MSAPELQTDLTGDEWAAQEHLALLGATTTHTTIHEFEDFE